MGSCFGSVEDCEIDGVKYRSIPLSYRYGDSNYKGEQPLGMKKRPQCPVTEVWKHLDIVVFKSSLVASQTSEPQIVGWVNRSDVPDPFFWHETLSPDWVKELIKMVEAK